MLPGVRMCLTDSNDISLIYYIIHNSSHDKSSQNVKQRMLLYEYSRQNNGYTQEKGTKMDNLIFCKLFIVYDCQMRSDGVIYMDTGPEICGGIHTI